MNKDKARQSLIASRNISKDTPVARRVAFLREAARAYVTGISQTIGAVKHVGDDFGERK